MVEVCLLYCSIKIWQYRNLVKLSDKKKQTLNRATTEEPLQQEEMKRCTQKN